ncbi:CDP-alcohol phosphatidyltransferase family protein [Sphingomonas piscis]|uniref:CDP-alcohol phosphatidyltransferase family protein n=2 Tax=Sphingomonas piscis TaxID=2714943 RepID=A0A6G7YTG9_9SPHN|nr:CDP-alcohol phosphatidyltransferase family protein [Sphingomonas piscis]
MRKTVSDAQPPLFLPVGDNPVPLFGMDRAVHARRLAGNAKFPPADSGEAGRGALLGNLAFAWDPAWLKAIGKTPDTALLYRGQPVIVHLADGADASPELIATGSLPDGLTVLDAETAELNYAELRKRERPFVLPLEESNRDQVERAYYDAAYKGVTDVLTLYLWRRPAFYLTKWAAHARITPNLVTAVGAIFCALAFWFFWRGQYWPGVATGFVFMVLDTVDGKLARCTGASSKWGNIFDHGIDLVHPPFWWWAWMHGLAAYGEAPEPVYASMLMWAIVGGYILQRVIEGIFMRRYGMHIHVWRPIDSQFRLITARRNPNMVLLVGALLFARPDVGIELVAVWTIVSLIFHAVRLAQADAVAERGGTIRSWLDR